jgi:hypothetical protein
VATSLLNLIQAEISLPGSQGPGNGLRPKALILRLGGSENQAEWDKGFSISYGLNTNTGFHRATYVVYMGC